MKHICPHCKSKATCRTSRDVTDLTRELYMQCHNIECGHTWKSIMTAVNTIVPSQVPNPRVFLARSRSGHVVHDRQLLLIPT